MRQMLQASHCLNAPYLSSGFDTCFVLFTEMNTGVCLAREISMEIGTFSFNSWNSFLSTERKKSWDPLHIQLCCERGEKTLPARRPSISQKARNLPLKKMAVGIFSPCGPHKTRNAWSCDERPVDQNSDLALVWRFSYNVSKKLGRRERACKVTSSGTK